MFYPIAPERRKALANAKHCHLIGVGGAGMSGLARILLAMGKEVTGSDETPSETTDALVRTGLTFCKTAFPSAAQKADLCIYSAAIPKQDTDRQAADAAGVLSMPYAEAVGILTAMKRTIAVAGAHGKTTTTSLVSWILREAGFHPSFLVGGEIKKINTNAEWTSGPLFVVEACEYARNFLHFRPARAIITNVEADHLDYYGSLDRLIDAYQDFANLLPTEGSLYINGDSDASRNFAPAGVSVKRFGYGRRNAWRVLAGWEANQSIRFELSHDGDYLDTFTCRLAGRHNIYNAVAAIAVCFDLGVPIQAIRKALETFPGVRRRFDCLLSNSVVTVVDDYAHHPSEIEAVLKAARQQFPRRRLLCVFQPHQYGRTREFFEQFARALVEANEVILAPVYSVRESITPDHPKITERLAQAVQGLGTSAVAVGSFEEALQRVFRIACRGDVILTVGAGPVDRLARSLVNHFRALDANAA